MTVTTMLAEITSRCGEGYENWSARAQAHFKQTVIDMIRSKAYDMSAYHGLVYSKSYTVPGSSPATISSVAIGTFIGADYELIEFYDIYYTATTVWHVDIVNRVESYASSLNSELKSSDRKQWYWNYDASSNSLVFETAIVATTPIYFTCAVWIDSLLTTGATIISDYFTQAFLQDAINMAADRLIVELKA